MTTRGDCASPLMAINDVVLLLANSARAAAWWDVFVSSLARRSTCRLCAPLGSTEGRVHPHAMARAVGVQRGGVGPDLTICLRVPTRRRRAVSAELKAIHVELDDHSRTDQHHQRGDPDEHRHQDLADDDERCDDGHEALVEEAPV